MRQRKCRMAGVFRMVSHDPPGGKEKPPACLHFRTMYCAAMATNLDIDLPAVDELMRLGRYRSKREAVDAAVREAIAYRRQLAARDFLGTIDFQPAVAALPPEA